MKIVSHKSEKMHKRYRSGPIRLNSSLRLLPYEADDPWVGAVLLTGHHLFFSSCSPSIVAGNSAFGLLLEIAEDIAGADQLVKNYREAEGAATESLDPKIRKDRSIVVPAIGNIESAPDPTVHHVTSR